MKNITFMLLLLGLSSGITAQEKEKSPEKRRANKIAYLSTKLELTPEEAQNFWPVYNQAEAEYKALHEAHKKARPTKKITEMSDEEVEKLIDEGLDFQQKELDIRKKYHENYKKVLPIKKVAKLLHLEHEYRRHQDGEKGHHPPGPPPGGKEKLGPPR